jgi:hypothetical protein
VKIGHLSAIIAEVPECTKSIERSKFPSIRRTRFESLT